MARDRSTPTLFDLEEASADPSTAKAVSRPSRERSRPEVRFGAFCDVALNRPVRQTFTYAVPDELAERVRRGVRVYVPFGSQRQVGVVVATSDTAARQRLRPVHSVLDGEPPVGETLLRLTEWIAERYACAWGEALAAVLPAPLKRTGGVRQELFVRAGPDVGQEQLAELEERFPKQFRLLRTVLELEGPAPLKDLLRQLQLSDSPARTLERRGWLRIEKRDVEPDPLDGPVAERPRPRPTPAQQQAIDALVAAMDRSAPGAGSAFLLHGVTGSGKTEVYLRTIEGALARGRSAIVLVPEIALTPQTVSWFRSRFDEVAVLHSRLTDAQRLAAWKRIARGDVSVVVGARSAIFAPLANPGVIVVDEEHEPSFKQGSTPRYHARDVAIERARLEGAVCVLGSATPSLESWQAAETGTLQRLSLPDRVGGGRLPEVHTVDMRLESEKHRDAPLFSRLLCHFLEETLEAGEQAILFLNRRGFIPILWCAGCRETLRCEQCDLALTYHRRIQRLVCHGCCEERAVPKHCPKCTAPGLRPFGIGSEKVESECKRMFPKARVRRMDSDTMRRREDYEETLASFGRGEVDVLVGTQMIAKGLDFPRVTLVGIVSADAALHLPDFRGAERTYQLVSQVAGRAGRSELPGRIVMQTMAPEHPAIRLAATNDYEGFAKTELLAREELGYPPHGRILRVVFEHAEEARVAASALHYAGLLNEASSDLVVLGPAPAPIAFLRGRHRSHLLVKAPAEGEAALLAARLLADSPTPKGLLAPKIDVDAVAML